MRKSATYLIVFFAAVAVAGCGGRKAVVDDTEVEVEAIETQSGIAGGDGASPSGLDDDTGSSGEGLGDSSGSSEPGADSGNDLLNQRVVYFDYDSSLLRPESVDVVRAHAGYLRDNPGTSIILEGHADERGTREYNLALGEDRAKSVANLMQADGVAGERIQTISYGEERPVALGHDESAWRLNRRVEFLYQ